jgi:hypothetical protein
MSHWAAAPRRAYVMVHHAGYPNAHLDNTSVFCPSSGISYDFQIRWDGTIIVCGAWDDATGRHALGCNCEAEGVLLMGCFGGCSSGNVAGPSASQECSLAYVIAHLGTPGITDRVRPHRNCFYWNPCDNPNPTSTVCCGTNLTTTSTTNQNWNSTGVAFRNRVLSKRTCWLSTCHCNCTGQCPS